MFTNRRTYTHSLELWKAKIHWKSWLTTREIAEVLVVMGGDDEVKLCDALSHRTRRMIFLSFPITLYRQLHVHFYFVVSQMVIGNQCTPTIYFIDLNSLYWFRSDTLTCEEENIHRDYLIKIIFALYLRRIYPIITRAAPAADEFVRINFTNERRFCLWLDTILERAREGVKKREQRQREHIPQPKPHLSRPPIQNAIIFCRI